MSGKFSMTKKDLFRLMAKDNPCLVCGIAGHEAWVCPKLGSPCASDSPLAKQFGDKKDVVRKMMAKYAKEGRVDPEPEEDSPASNAALSGGNSSTTDQAETDLLNARSSQGSATIDSLQQVRDITQTEPVETQVCAQSGGVNAAGLGAGNDFKPLPNVSKAKQANFSLRTQFAAPVSTVYTNHFEVNFKPDTKFFVYEILKMPTKTKRKTKFIMKTALQAWGLTNANTKGQFATDYVKTIVAWEGFHDRWPFTRIADGDAGTRVGAIWEPAAIADGTERIQLFIKLQRILDTAGLQAYMNATAASDPNFNVDPIVDALNIVVSANLQERSTFQLSTNKFFVKSGHEDLNGGRGLKALCTIRGYSYTLKPGMQKLFLNVNAATSAFFRPITVEEFLKDGTFDAHERLSLLKTLRLYIEPDRRNADNPEDQKHVDHLNKPQNRIKSFFGLGPKLNDKTMFFNKAYKDAEGQWHTDPNQTRVDKHMRDVFGKAFDASQEAINVGTKEDPVYYPREYLRILPYQIYKRLLPDNLVDGMLQAATHLPAVSRNLTEIEGMKSLGLDPTQLEQDLPGCSKITIKPTMLKIPSSQMPALSIVYGKNSPKKTPNASAQWDLRGLRDYFDAVGKASHLNYLILAEPGLKPETLGVYETAFGRLLRDYGVCAGAMNRGRRELSNFRHGGTFACIRGEMEQKIRDMKAAFPNANLVILLLKNRSLPAYTAFKDITDRIIGIQSLCLTEEPNIDKCTRDLRPDISQYMANITMKANLKLGGLNHTVEVQSKVQSSISTSLAGTLVLGADVTHPSSNSLTGCPSIAAVVGSVNATSTKYLGSMRLQKTSKKEIIDDFRVMVEERIDAYIRATSQAPRNIIYFRDGVSTGQFDKVRDEELLQIREAFKNVFGSPMPKITVIVAVKRHATRFYPAGNLNTKNGNCQPGTLVDRAIVSPHYSDFYLQSHHGLKGTAIPTHYVVIANEIGLSDTAMQELIWKMCYTYVRATIGVSQVPPAYYADRLCERGRAYFRDWFSPDLSSDHYQDYQAKKDKAVAAVEAEKSKELAKCKSGPKLYGRNAPKKTAEQIDIERKYRRKAEEDLEKTILQDAENFFKEKRSGGPGPWNASLDGTMFWM